MAAPQSDDARARRYHRRQFALAIVDLALGAATLVGWLWTGAAAAAAGAFESRLGSVGAAVALAAAVGGAATLVTFPLDVAAGFVLPRRAGLLTQSFAAWLADRAKATLVGALLALGAVALVYALIGWSPRWWWLLAAGALGGLSALLAAVVPIWLVPLFYRLTPLGDPDLRARLLRLAGRVGAPAADVAVADFSRKGPTANAGVVGLGRTRRILVSDTLLQAFPPEEIEVVLAHELAHHARGHLGQGLVVHGAVILAALWATAAVLDAAAPALGLTGPGDPAGVPLLLLVGAGIGLVVAPLLAAWSRRLEREADRVALEVTRAPAAFVAAMERLGALNLAERRPGRVRELLLATHPSIEERIALASAFPTDG